MVILVVITIFLIPVYLQGKFGVKSAAGWLSMSHLKLTCLCLLMEIILAVILFFPLMYFDTDRGLRCGIGWVGLVLFAIPLSFIILIMGIFQRIFIKRD